MGKREGVSPRICAGRFFDVTHSSAEREPFPACTYAQTNPFRPPRTDPFRPHGGGPAPSLADAHSWAKVERAVTRSFSWPGRICSSTQEWPPRAMPMPRWTSAVREAQLQGHWRSQVQLGNEGRTRGENSRRQPPSIARSEEPGNQDPDRQNDGDKRIQADVIGGPSLMSSLLLRRPPSAAAFAAAEERAEDAADDLAADRTADRAGGTFGHRFRHGVVVPSARADLWLENFAEEGVRF